jgi:hypothetical protein
VLALFLVAMQHVAVQVAAGLEPATTMLTDERGHLQVSPLMVLHKVGDRGQATDKAKFALAVKQLTRQSLPSQSSNSQGKVCTCSQATDKAKFALAVRQLTGQSLRSQSSN